MSKDPRITLFYSPQTRATGARVLLEELKAPYDLHVLNMKTGEQRQPAYLAINPLGKVPAVRVNDTLVTEQGAIYLYLADLFPEAGLAPALTDPDRGAYLRWLFIYGSCFEPAVVDRLMKREPGSMNETPYASYESVIDMLEEALKTGPTCSASASRQRICSGGSRCAGRRCSVSSRHAQRSRFTWTGSAAAPASRRSRQKTRPWSPSMRLPRPE
jgi:glutathione S-transferase